MKISIGQFLIERLVEAGCHRIYGVPGDYNLEFLELVEKDERIDFIGNCNELNAAYAADGDARISGFSTVLTTYGVGDLSTIAGIAGAYAEGVPVLSLSGAPPLEAIQTNALVHHTLADGNYDNVRKCFAEFTVAHTLITPENAYYEIDRVLAACLREKKPVYLQLPSDICYLEIEVPERGLVTRSTVTDQASLNNLTDVVLKQLAKAEKPLIMVDGLVRSHQLAEQLEAVITAFNIPFVALNSGKALISENHPLFLGMYGGKSAAQPVFNYVEEADCILAFGVRFVDATSSWFTQKYNVNAYIDIQAYSTRFQNVFFNGIAAQDLLKSLMKNAPSEHGYSLPHVASPQGQVVSADAAWCQDVFWQRMRQFFAKGDVIIAENGTSLVGLARSRFPEGVSFISQPIWGAIGYTLPSLLGAGMAAPQRRQFLFIGDGSFQVTAQELSTIIHQKMKPIIFLINNDGYTIERMILGENSSYNDVAAWKYHELPGVMAPEAKIRSTVVTNLQELDVVLAEAEKADELTFIEVCFERMDGPTGMAAFGKKACEYDYGFWGRDA
ncbi:alpha-keto acid decarboxylase family protein [Neokomagataea anthophila]|uniref:Alpha-keto acid decarboxylase family protein n=1 Tax=Neokomagataea anthophila TaxID=2826925 RepID=A0ABS5E4P7_9PROT|nr:thiamine pyrophosphate-binding protein [Neokomagataea anthophila]MBR0558503.1 alpha-keto acid decarboxylase family protein [Neokomagataea anthophila]